MEKKRYEMPAYFLFGLSDNSETEIAKNRLNEAKIEYSFVPANNFEGVMPQLHSGLTSHIGLDSILKGIKNARKI